MRELILRRKTVIVIVLVLCSYFSLLALISFARAPKEEKAIGESLVKIEDFEVEAKEGRAWIDQDGLHFNDLEGTEKKFSTPIFLDTLQQIQVKLSVYCPEELAGPAVLHVDLCTDGYDKDEQEFVVELEAGRTEITQVIDKGSDAPSEVQFRIFCLDAVQCEISGLAVQIMETVSYQGREIICIVLIAVLSGMLIALLTAGDGKKLNNHSPWKSISLILL